MTGLRGAQLVRQGQCVRIRERVGPGHNESGTRGIWDWGIWDWGIWDWGFENQGEGEWPS
jgi:hypothetical protein